MPKAKRERIASRGLVEVNAGGGTSGVPAATRVNARAPSGGQAVVGSSRYSGSGWALLSKGFAELAEQARIAEAKKQAEAEKAASKAEAEARARMDSVDRIAGEAAGIRLLAEIDERSRSGEMGLEDAERHVTSLMQQHGNSQAFLKSWEPYAKKSLILAGDSEFGKRRAEEANAYLAVTRQGINDLHASYDPERYEEYAHARTAIFESRSSLGISGQAINELELSSLVNHINRTAMENPVKAQELMDLAERLRPDGSPSLAASAADGYATLQALRENVAKTILTDSANEKREAAEALKESTKENYLLALSELIQMDHPDKAAQWASENVDNLSGAEFKAKYGDYRADVMTAVQAAKSNQSPAGNELALAEHLEGIQRGTAEWADIYNDPRLNSLQKQKLFTNMQEITQKSQLGYISDALLAGKLLTDLEAAWADSVYGSPWSASRQIDPGRPPVITPEGLFYQGELFKRLRQLDPDLNVNESNRKKQEITQDVANEVLSGKLRWRDHAAGLQESFPELSLKQKIADSERLSESNVSDLAKAFNTGGVRQIRDGYGVNFFEMDGLEQRRIVAEAQRQRAELEALQAETFFGSGRIESALDQYGRDIMGMPMDIYDSDPVVRSQGIAEEMLRERERLQEQEERLERIEREPRGMAPAHRVLLQRDIARTRKRYDALKARHDEILGVTKLKERKGQE